MIPACNNKRCAAFPFENGIHFRRKTDFFPEEDTTISYSNPNPLSYKPRDIGYQCVQRRIRIKKKFTSIIGRCGETKIVPLE
ncbi:hypothetical protein TNCV_2530591 [Trichonephila clavipes]|nr:hypothetical protein TNCV_2530591 [Trichonephila clavipes]